MRVPIEMAQLGFDMETGKISGWLKNPGDHVDKGEAIAEVETEKAMVEIEALASGTLVEIVHGPGDEVPIGAVIGYLDEET